MDGRTCSYWFGDQQEHLELSPCPRNLCESVFASSILGHTKSSPLIGVGNQLLPLVEGGDNAVDSVPSNSIILDSIVHSAMLLLDRYSFTASCSGPSDSRVKKVEIIDTNPFLPTTENLTCSSRSVWRPRSGKGRRPGAGEGSIVSSGGLLHSKNAAA